MAINMNSGDSIPRISFSHDLQGENPTQTWPKGDAQVTRLDQSLLTETETSPPGSDFDFCVTSSGADLERETCPADELFFNGVIIPTQMRDKIRVITNKEITAMTKATLVREEKVANCPSKSFWRFRRSSSLNCEKQRSSIWSSLPLLLRSRSTGSSSICEKDTNLEIQSSKKNKNQKNSTTRMSSKLLPPQYQKPNGRNARNCSSVLNVPPPYIAKGTSDLLGLGSFFRNGSREKRTNK